MGERACYVLRDADTGAFATMPRGGRQELGHGGCGVSLDEALVRAGAPEELSQWVETAGEAVAWDGNDRGDWSVWMAAARGLPIGRVLQVAMEVLVVLRRRFDRPRTVLETIDATLAAVAHEDGEALLGLVEQVERLADDGPSQYRQQMPPGVRALARATGLMARAVEARLAAHAILESQLSLEALTRAGAVGVPQFVMQRDIGELTLSSSSPGEPVFEPLVYALDAASEAMREAARVVVSEDDSRLDQGDAEVADLLFEPLDQMLRRLAEL